MAEQKYTSARTSINKTRLPCVYNKVSFPKGKTVLDYGCGRYIDHIKRKVEGQGCEYHPYDPYNLPNSKIPKMKFDYAVCSNVLNVIAEDETVKEVIQNVCNNSNIAYFTVYEGNGTGVGRPTGKDNYQRNERTGDYVKLIKDMGYDVSVKNKVIKVGGVA